MTSCRVHVKEDKLKQPIEQDQLAQIVAEVERLAKYGEEELNHEQVQQILSELNPPMVRDWQVQMSWADRVLSSNSFTVK